MPIKPTKYEIHVTLSEDEGKQLKAVAQRESRAVAKQVAHYVREALKREKIK